MLVMHRAVEVAIGKAKQHGVGLVGARNLSATIGSLGYYLETIANAGLVGLIFTHSQQSPSAITSAVTGIAGSGPVGVSVPSSRGAVVLDAATAASSVLGVTPSVGVAPDACFLLMRRYGDVVFCSAGLVPCGRVQWVRWSRRRWSGCGGGGYAGFLGAQG